MPDTFRLLDIVALTADLPGGGLMRGQVGTIVETLRPDVFEVEFCDNDGRTYASLALRASQLMVLHHEPIEAAQPGVFISRGALAPGSYRNLHKPGANAQCHLLWPIFTERHALA